jgi:hypothetical protein
MNEEITEEQEVESSDPSKKQAPSGVPYCVEDVFASLATIDKIVDESGTATVITKEDISKITGKKTNTLVLTFSTYQQYGILEKVHGKGFLPSALYKKYREKIYDHHEREALLEMFKKPPLYAKIIEKLNGTHLPSTEKFPALLKDEPYNVNINSADRASKVFFENARGLKLITSNNKFVFPTTPIKEEGIKKEEKPDGFQQGERMKRSELVELPIHLPGEGGRAVYFQYPKTLTKRDFKIIAKALTFVASSLIIDEANEDYEITIKVEESKIDASAK